MCLERVYKIPKNYDRGKVRVGYKYLHTYESVNWVVLPFRCLSDGTNLLCRGKWYKAGSGKKRVAAYDKNMYEPAFHLYPKQYHGFFTKVLYRKVVARGVQDGFPVVVAREILVPSKPS